MAPPSGSRPSPSSKGRDSRSNSATSSPLPPAAAKPSSKRQPDAAVPASQPARKVHYTLIVRLPFPRGDFEDPPQVEWNADRDRKLWRVIANTPKIGDLDWEEIANEFRVDLNFILQQAAWLYQRHMDNVREQMKKVGASTAGGSGSHSPVLGHQSTVGGIPMKRLGSGGSNRTPSSLSIRPRDSIAPIGRGSEFSMPGTPKTNGMCRWQAVVSTMLTNVAAPALSRTPSTTTVTQSKFAPPSSPRQTIQRSLRTSNSVASRKSGPATDTKSPDLRSPTTETARSSPAESDSSSSSSDSDEVPTRRSRIFAHRPQARFQSHKKSGLNHVLGDDDGEDSEDEDSPTFAMVSSKPQTSDNGASSRRSASDSRRERAFSGGKASARDTAAHIPAAVPEDEHSTTSSMAGPERSNPAQPEQTHEKSKGKGKVTALSSSASSAASSAAAAGPQQSPLPRRPPSSTGYPSSLQSPASPPPHHRTELARLQSPGRRRSSPRRRATANSGKPGDAGAGATTAGTTSDGTPSMGSSFSDLDDTSITQSALEEALASNLRHGGGSRLSNFGTLGNAFRSRYT